MMITTDEAYYYFKIKIKIWDRKMCGLLWLTFS